MAFNRYLGGYGQPGPAPGLLGPPIQQQGFRQPPPRYIGPPAIGAPPPDFTIQGRQNLGGLAPSIPQPQLGGGGGGATNRYLGGFGKPGNLPGVAAGEPLDPFNPGVSQNRYLGGYDQPPPVTPGPLPPPVPIPGGGNNTVPPITPGPVGGRVPGSYVPPQTGPGSPGWTPGAGGSGRYAGAPTVPGEASGRYLGGSNRLPHNPRGGQGAAQAFLGMLSTGWRPANGMGVSGFTEEWADNLRNNAIASLQGVPDDPFGDPEWQAWLRAGAPLEQDQLSGQMRKPNFLRGPERGAFEESFDWEGNPVGVGGAGGGFGPEGGGGSWPAGPDFGVAGTQADEDAYYEWMRANGLLGWNDAGEGQS